MEHMILFRKNKWEGWCSVDIGFSMKQILIIIVDPEIIDMIQDVLWLKCYICDVLVKVTCKISIRAKSSQYLTISCVMWKAFKTYNMLFFIR